MRLISKIIIGVVFVFSGIVKGIDPLGSAYKFNDYFLAFGTEWLSFISLGISIVLSTAEFLIGMALLLGLRLRLTAWALLLFMGFFTLLTFYSAIFDPVTDCGCFGDAVVLSNWATFYKNLIFLALSIIIFTGRKNYPILYPGKYSEWAIILIIFLGFFSMSIYSKNHLPLIDFRPYHVGSNLPEKMEIPEGEPMDEYETYLYYERDGETKEFTSDDYPWQDTTWKWVETKQVLVKEGYKPPIHDFVITDDEGFDITDQILDSRETVFMMISYDLKKANFDGLEKIRDLATLFKQKGYTFYPVTASTNEVIINVKERIKLTIPFYFGDEIMLKTVVRANPGLVAIKNGTVIGKWHFSDIPPKDDFEKDIFSTIIGYNHQQKDQVMVTAFILGIFLFIALVRLTRFKWLIK